LLEEKNWGKNRRKQVTELIGLSQEAVQSTLPSAIPGEQSCFLRCVPNPRK
jgi:hypothetical protein